METSITLAVGIDNKHHVIHITEKFNIAHSKVYLELAKHLTENIGPAILGYNIAFENKKYTNILELAESLISSGKEEINKITNPKPDKTHYEDFLIKDIDYINKTVTFSEEATLQNIVAIIRNIPTLFPFKIKQKEKEYENVSAVAKTEFSRKEYTKGVIIGLTNSFLEDAAKEQED